MVRRAMKTSRIATVLILVSCALFVVVGSKWLGQRESRASALQVPAEVEEPRQHDVALLAAADPIADREEAPAPVLEAKSPPAAIAPPATPQYVFLPDDLQPLATLVREHLKAFDEATPAQQLDLARDLLVHSIAVIQCATETGPIPKGTAGDGDLSHTGRDGKWAFQVNSWTFHLNESQFPEYPEYMALLNAVREGQMIPLSTAIELPADLAQRIRERAQEALSWL